jgi:Fic family protein
MRRNDLSASRQRQLVKAAGHPHCHALLPPPTPRRLPVGPGLTRQLQLAHEALGRLAALTEHLPNSDLITRTLARREAVQSSQIEGTQTDLSQLLEYEATGGPDGLPADATVTERYVTALELGLAALRDIGSRAAVSNVTIKAMHRVLLQDASEAYRAGEYRLTQAWIGGYRIEDSTFVPPPPEYIEGCMDELEASMLQYERRDDEFGEISIVTQLVLAHAQFETIHPFVDGNGRVGRLIMPLMLASAGYPPLYLSGYLLRHRLAYYDALAGVQLRDDWERWGEFLCRAIAHACETSIAVSRDLNAIHDRWAVELSDLRADAAARKMPRLLLGRPVVSVRQVAELLGMSFVSANNAVEVLVSRGILSEPEGRRNRVFHATELLARLEAP